MSAQLWQAYHDDDLQVFRRLLATGPTSGRTARPPGPVIGSPGNLGTSPSALRARRSVIAGSVPSNSGSAAGGHHSALTRAEVNARDATGQTLLHWIASSTRETAQDFAAALVEYPAVDLYLQDAENGWTALHRAFYFGNITIARQILERDAADTLGKLSGHAQPAGGLVKIKDREGNGPLDLYAATIKDRTLRSDIAGRQRSNSNDSQVAHHSDESGENSEVNISVTNIGGDQLYTFGSNKNVSLGFGDEDDRQFPERINIRRPDRLLRRFYMEFLEENSRKWKYHDSSYEAPNIDVDKMWIEDIPWLVRSRPLLIQDVQMSKLHSAVITNDPESNLYICGHGQGGRLGTGDEQTRFNFVCIEGGALAGKRVASAALGLNHTLALSSEGDIFSWGGNGYGQLGYSLPRATASDEDPIGLLPRQIFGILKREIIIGIAASRIHSVAHTKHSLYTFGKNEGQLGIMDSDARSLEMQVTPRKVAASLFAAPIVSATAMDKATACLLDNHEVWVFANYGYAKVQIVLEGFTNYFLAQSFSVTSYEKGPNRIAKLTCGGDTICALSTRGEVYTISISQRVENPSSSSTTNPAKIKNAVPAPQRIWSPRKSNMAARDVGVDADGSIILSTEEGSVWKRTKRATLKSASASGTGEYKPKDYKFSRIPGLTRVLAVRASAYGAYAAIRRDCDVTQTQIVVDPKTLGQDLLQLCALRHPLSGLILSDLDEGDNIRHRFWQAHKNPSEAQLLKRAIIECKDIEATFESLATRVLSDAAVKFDAILRTTSSHVAIPVHRFMLTSRSRVMRKGFRDLCETSTFTVPDLAVSELDRDGRAVVRFQDIDILTLVNLVYYIYADNVIDFMPRARSEPHLAYRYRQVRNELMKIATKLELGKVEVAARQMVDTRPSLSMDLEYAFRDPAFFYDGDILIQLEDDEIRVHSALVCARCPFFRGLFGGRAGGRWLEGRSGGDEDITVDLEHINAKTFDIVLRHIYTDGGTELFDHIVSVSLDDFLDFVMDVMGAANELLLDRLSQICQQIIGRFVNVRNVCGLLNAVSPSSVHEFKDAALEYLCLSLEAMLQGHHLNELDDDLLDELDSVVRENQLACMPFAKSNRAELLLHQRHPELGAILERDRQVRIDAIRLRLKFSDVSKFAMGSVEDEAGASPARQRTRRRSSNARAEGGTPILKSKSSTKDMMFAMEEEFDDLSKSPAHSPSLRPMAKSRLHDNLGSSPLPEDSWYDSKGKAVASPQLNPRSPSPGTTTPNAQRSPHIAGKTPPSGSQPWTLTPLSAPKVDLKGIMAQAASSRTSTLSQGLATSNIQASPVTPSKFSLPVPKMSQKDRKRMQRSATGGPTEVIKPERADSQSTTTTTTATAWQIVPGQRPAPLKDILGTPSSEPAAAAAKAPPGRTTSTPQLTMRQTVANGKGGSQTAKGVIGPAAKSDAPQQRSVSESKSTTSQGPNGRPTGQSVRYQPYIEPPLGLSMSEILAAQQLEKDVVREAAAKRDLQDIQAEQEFEEWWKRESARVQQAEQRNAAASSGAAAGKNGKRHRAGGRRGKGNRAKGEQNTAGDGEAAAPSSSTNPRKTG